MKSKFSTIRKSALAAAMTAAAVLSACSATPLKPTIVGYTCCNLRSDAGWISSNNVQGGAIVPAGEPVVLESIKKRYYVYGTVGGADTGLRDDNAKSEADTIRWAHSIVVAENPRARISSWPEDIRRAVQYGKVIVGMSKEQVLTSLGYPSRSDTPDIGAAVWRYWTPKDDLTVDLHFNESGRLASLSGMPSAIDAVSEAQ